MRLSCLFLLALSPSSLLADSEVVLGQRLFALHCAACHGEDARGTGSVGEVLDENPADLTTLAQRNGGTFPVAQTVAKIDGRSMVDAHGATMPVYGYFFEGPPQTINAPSGTPVETTQAIAQLVSWLMYVQR